MLTAGDCMSTPCVTVTLGTRLDVCCTTMEENRVRRLVVVDQEGFCWDRLAGGYRAPHCRQGGRGREGSLAADGLGLRSRAARGACGGASLTSFGSAACPISFLSRILFGLWF